MTGQERSDFYVVFTMNLCALQSKQTLNKFAILTHTAWNLGIQALRSYLKITREYELHTLSNAKVSAAKDHGKNYMKVRPLPVRHL